MIFNILKGINWIHYAINIYFTNVNSTNYEMVSGYIGTTKSNDVWLITSAKIKDKNTASLSIINDYGSEDLTCTLSLNTDNTFTLKQDNGATLKIVADRKYVKIPKSIIFKRK